MLITGHFEEHNTDIQTKRWTILIEALSNEMGSKFSHPESKLEAHTLFHKYNIINEYVSNRESTLEKLRKKNSQFTHNNATNDADNVQKAKFSAIECFLMFFEDYKYKKYNVI